MMPSDSLKTDLYELTMAAGYFTNGFNPSATFELYCHTMPENRSYLVACGLEQIVDYILGLRFSGEDIDFLKAQPVFRNTGKAFFDYLRGFRFTGDVWAMAEGEICFANEPILQVEAPIIEAQLLETYLLSVINIETSVASKAARVVHAACCDGVRRGVVDFGSRRAHGPEAGVLAARAAYLAGCEGTSNVYAGKQYDIPVFGTMAHSWVQAFPGEETAFAEYQAAFPENTILLIDTYDTIRGARKAVKLGRDIRGVRLDSGDLNVLCRRVRRILDDGGMPQVKIVASGNLNEYKVRELVGSGTPVDTFGVGTEMVVARDYPALDLTYKLVQTRSAEGRVEYKAKLSRGKQTVPGRKQVFRFFDSGRMMTRDLIALADERAPTGGQPLLTKIIAAGDMAGTLPSVKDIRERVQKRLSCLPAAFYNLNRRRNFKVDYSPKVRALKQRVRRQARG